MLDYIAKKSPVPLGRCSISKRSRDLGSEDFNLSSSSPFKVDFGIVTGETESDIQMAPYSPTRISQFSDYTDIKASIVDSEDLKNSSPIKLKPCKPKK